ncbi:MAG TPA: penicillin-insensitive murein endopeptidase [Solirubrobacteraceae bacterium]|nr:penicillin-insensitive murein endopeptidase [Solirubrobacteraceae bacterium]
MHLLAAAVATAALLPPPAPAVPELPSRAVGVPHAGRLVHGVQLPEQGAAFFTWDWGTDSSPNRDWRRWGTSRTVTTTLTVLAEFHAAHPDAPRIGVADLSRPRGGTFDARYGGSGHASHQNGRDVDVTYPRKDRLERPPLRAAQIDRTLAQDLLDRFVRAGATAVFIGPDTGLTRKRRLVQWLSNHTDHMHVRFPP